MSDEELTPEGEDYDLMVELERLESLREDLLENNLTSLSEIESALALLPTGDATDERREILSDIRTELLELDLASLEQVEAKIDSLNDQLDNLGEEA